MKLPDLPDASGPQIEGVRPRYQIGDTVRANCTSSRSRPAAKLAWYINQEPVCFLDCAKQFFTNVRSIKQNDHKAILLLICLGGRIRSSLLFDRAR